MEKIESSRPLMEKNGGSLIYLISKDDVMDDIIRRIISPINRERGEEKNTSTTSLSSS
ncbi:hypothetical protein LguiA_023881 [Lonicera macranthoides]